MYLLSKACRREEIPVELNWAHFRQAIRTALEKQSEKCCVKLLTITVPLNLRQYTFQHHDIMCGPYPTNQAVLRPQS